MAIASALFNLPARTLSDIRNRMDAKTSSSSDVSVHPHPEGSVAIGERQQVMFLIGEVASHGEDGLTLFRPSV